MNAQDGIRQGYKERREQFQQQFEQWQSLAQTLTLSRFLIFLFGIVGFGVAAFSDYSVAGLTLGILAALVFVAVVIYHDWVDRQQRRAQHLVWLQSCGLSRLNRNWNLLAVGPNDTSLAEDLVPLDTDLDVSGKASLFRLCSATNTQLGQRTLLDWLVEPASAAEIRLRQDAVEELSAKRDLCEEIHVRSALLGLGSTDPRAFFEWAEGPRWLHDRTWLIWLSRLIPLLIIGSFFVIGSGVLSDLVASLLLITFILANCAISVIYTGHVHDIFGRISSKEGEVQQYGELFERLLNYPLQADRLKHLQGQIAKDVSRRLSQLNRIMRGANLRHSGLFGVFYFLFQILFLWDFHVLWFLERWQSNNCKAVRPWFVALAQWEALTSLATLRHDHPHWCFPQVDEGFDSFEAKSLGHPHLSLDECVTNDVHLGPRGKMLLVTGSNMSGKSTLLRSIGTNILLAQAGGPVCATELKMPLVRLHTSMRIRDSLAEGTSFYMAELKRLKEIVDRTAAEEQRCPFFLLDEILQGTNSGERHIAVSCVVAQLLRYGAMGAISTHDLELADSAELKSNCEVIHFRESFEETNGEREMTFDYCLRPGVAPTTNALELLRIVGIEE